MFSKSYKSTIKSESAQYKLKTEKVRFFAVFVMEEQGNSFNKDFFHRVFLDPTYQAILKIL